MTRDEAIALLHKTPFNSQFAETMDAIESQKFVAGLVALGLLKLDEPVVDDQSLICEAKMYNVVGYPIDISAASVGRMANLINRMALALERAAKKKFIKSATSNTSDWMKGL